MKRLNDLQWNAIYEGVLRVLRTNTVEAFARESLGCIASLVPARQYMLFTFSKNVPGDVHFGQVYTYGTTIHYLDAFLNGNYMDQDWIFNRINMKAMDGALRDSDFIAEEELVKLGVYQDIYKRDGVHYGMRLTMISNGSITGSYNLFRAKESGDFSDQELEICNRLAPLFSVHYNRLIAPAAATDETSGLTRMQAADRFGVTAREYQVARLMAQGRTEAEVADQLSISTATVKKHLYNAYAKLGVNKRSQLEELFR